MSDHMAVILFWAEIILQDTSLKLVQSITHGALGKKMSVGHEILMSCVRVEGDFMFRILHSRKMCQSASATFSCDPAAESLLHIKSAGHDFELVAFQHVA